LITVKECDKSLFFINIRRDVAKMRESRKNMNEINMKIRSA